jgi:hypothetical protein
MLSYLAETFLGRSNKQVPPPAAPENIEIRTPLEDDIDEIEAAELAEEVEEDDLGEYLVIRYVNVKGEESTRRITVHRFSRRDGLTYIHAYCHERRAARQFRSDRIESVIDVETGEVLDENQEIADRLATMARPKTIEHATDQAVADCRSGLIILMFLARCDGLHPSEIDVILQYLDHSCAAPGIDETRACEAISRMWPDEVAYARAVRRLSQFNPDELHRTARFARHLIDADGALSAEEHRFAQQLSAALT